MPQRPIQARSCVAIALASTALLAWANPGHAELADAVDAYLAPYVAADQISGNLLIARGDEILYERSFGMADYERGIAVTPDTRFCVASITKPMTLVLAIKLLEEGAIGMDDTLSKWFPDFPRGDRITFIHVLRHRAGFPHRVTTPDEESTSISSQEMVDRVMAHVQESGFLCEPGEKSIYSSAGYSVAARVCELATGKSYAELLREYVLQPAGMTQTVDASVGAALPAHAQSYTDTWPGVRAAEDKDYSFLVGAGSVFSTARDIHAFMRAVADTVYGAGVRGSLMSDGNLDENGITNGFRAFADYDGTTDLYVSFTGNRYTGATNALRSALLRLVAGEELPAPFFPEVNKVTLSEEQLHRLEGSWISNDGADFEVIARDGIVYAGWYALIPTSESTFFSPQDYATVTFTLAGERAVRIAWETPEEPLVWTRVEP